MSMPYRRLGDSGLEVSELCLGTMMFGDRTDAATAQRIVDSAFDAGVNFIDTADVYAKGASETIVGASIARARRRWILASKVANVMTGLRLATNERVVVADDDVRFGPEILDLVARLDEADVRPRNAGSLSSDAAGACNRGAACSSNRARTCAAACRIAVPLSCIE